MPTNSVSTSLSPGAHASVFAHASADSGEDIWAGFPTN